MQYRIVNKQSPYNVTTLSVYKSPNNKIINHVIKGYSYGMYEVFQF